jgi:hypothetical protein
MAHLVEAKAEHRGLYYYEASQEEAELPKTPAWYSSGTSLEWHIKSYAVGSRRAGERKVILRDIGTKLV